MTPDQSARDRIRSELDRNLFVEASAGTGKTRELVSRIVALAASGQARAGEIAAVTFTRKAAGELRERLEIDLERARDSEEDHVRKERLVLATEEIDTGFIGTIHAFCAELLRQRPVEAGLAPGFREVDDRDPELLELRDRVWQEQLDQAEAGEDDAARTLLAGGIEPADLRGAYETVCGHPDVEFPPGDPGPEEDAAAAGAALCTAAKAALDFLDRALRELEGALRAGGIRGTFEDLRRRFRNADLDEPSSAAEALSRFDVVIEGPRSEPKRTPTPGQTQQAAAWRVLDGDVRPALRRWRRRLYPPSIEFAAAAARRFRDLRRTRGLATFTDLLLLARDMLRGWPEVRRDLARRFPRILVDEFQDTDPVQAEVLLLLAAAEPCPKDWTEIVPRPGSLFVVGDPKQSIYRFRRADPAVYERFRQILLRHGDRIRLSASFRSVPAICEFVNRGFRELLRREDDSPPKDGAELTAVRAEPAGPAVFRLPVEIEGRKRAGEAAARHSAIAADFVASQIADRGLRPRDFLFLARKRSRLDLYQRELESRGIRAEILTGREQGRVEDVPASLLGFAALLEAAASPADPVAVLAFLRSALCGSSDEMLWRFRRTGGALDPFGAAPPGTPDPIASGLPLLRECAGKSNALPPGAAVAAIADLCGLFAATAAESHAESAAATAARVVTLARRLSSEGLTFRRIASELAAVVRGAEVSATSLDPDADAVRLMTIHSAKGLEAPVVVLADPGDEARPRPPGIHIERGARAIGSMLVFRQEPGGRGSSADIVAEPPGWEAMAEEEARAEEDEEIRMLYVAATRARDTLVVGTCRRAGSDGPSASGPWARLDPFLERDLPRPSPATSRRKESVDLVRAHGVAIPAIAARRVFLGRPSYRVETATHRRPESGAGPVSDGQPGRGAAFGTVLHRLLEALMRRDESDLNALADLFARDEELSPAETEDVVLLAKAVRSSKLWERARAADACFVEVPFAVPVPDGAPGLLRGAVDLVFHETAGWVVVDYKTDRVSAGRLPGLVERYRPQVEIYRREWEEFSGEKTRAALFFVETGEPVWL